MKKGLFIVFILVFFNIHSQEWVNIGQSLDGEVEGGAFGRSVSLSNDGKIVAVGDPLNNENGDASGSVRVFENISSDWVQIGNNIVGKNSFDYSGSSVSLSGDGKFVAIGASDSDSDVQDSGNVRVFENISGTWTQVGQDINGLTPFENFGYSVSLSNDGQILAVGATSGFSQALNIRTGAVRIYINDNGVWKQIGEDIDGENFTDKFGTSLNLNAQGDIVAIGSPYNSNINYSGSGHVRIYKNISDSWIQIGEDIDGKIDNESLGKCLSLNNDGNIVAIGASNLDDNLLLVRIYKSIDDVWQQIGEDINFEYNLPNTSFSVSLNGEGDILAVGGIGVFQRKNNFDMESIARIYKNKENIWEQYGSDILITDLEDDYGAQIVSLNDKGNIIAVANPSASVYDDSSYAAGQVYVLEFMNETLSTVNNFLDIKSVKLFPNPANETISIKQSEAKITEIIIYSIKGELIKSIDRNLFDSDIEVTDLVRGTYILKINSEKGSVIKQFVKN